MPATRSSVSKRKRPIVERYADSGHCRYCKATKPFASLSRHLNRCLKYHQHWAQGSNKRTRSSIKEATSHNHDTDNQTGFSINCDDDSTDGTPPRASLMHLTTETLDTVQNDDNPSTQKDPETEEEEEEEDNPPLSHIELDTDDEDSILAEEPQETAIETTIEKQMAAALAEERANLEEASAAENCSPLLQEIRSRHPHLGAKLHRPATSAMYDAWRIDDNKTISMIRLIDYCDRSSGKGRKFLDGLLEMIAEEMELRNFNPKMAPKTETIRKNILKKFGNGARPVVSKFRMNGSEDPYLLPNDGRLHSRSREILDCISFCVRRNTLDLLQDRGIVGKIENLVVNKDDPFLPYSERCDEILGGSWYRDTIVRLKGTEEGFNEKFEFLLPYIFYVDKTGTCDNQRYPLEPFIFSLAIFRRKIRNHPRAWRPIGFIPDLESKSAAEHKYLRSSKQNPSSIPQSYHRFLAFLLQGFEKIQNEGIVTWLRIGDDVKKVRLRPELAFIIGDGKSADMLTSRHGGHQKGATRISRACKTGQAECDDITKTCQYIESTNTLEVDSETWDKYAHHDIQGRGRLRRTEIGEAMKVCQATPEAAIEIYPQLLNGSSGRPRKLVNARSGSRHEDEKGRLMQTIPIARGIVESRQEMLKKAGFHPVYNAFLARCIRFGLDPRNIWGANPTDLMHAFQSGIMMYLTKMALDKLPPKKKAELDRLVDEILGDLRTSEKDSLPRFNFTKGFTKVSMITSDEWAGKLFVLLIVMSTNKGRDILSKYAFNNENIVLPASFWELSNLEMARELQETAKEKDANASGVEEEAQSDDDEGGAPETRSKATTISGEKPEEILRKCSYFDFVTLAEALLCFHAWYKLDAAAWFSRGGTGRYLEIQDSTRRLLGLVKLYMPRKSGNQWKIQKFHDILHLADDIRRFGSPKNFDAGVLESSLRYWAKFPALTSQNRGSNEFLKQVANRLYELQAFAKALRENNILGVGMPPRTPDPPSPVKKPCLGGATFHVQVTCTKEGAFRLTKVPQLRGTSKGYSSLSPMVEEKLLAETIEGSEGIVKPKKEEMSDSHITHYHWTTRTECTIPLVETPLGREGENPVLRIRCDPNYNSEGPWYDWVMVNFQIDDESKVLEDADTGTPFYQQGCVPCKVLAFVEDHDTKEINAVVHVCDYQTRQDMIGRSVLLEQWRLQYYPSSDREHQGMLCAGVEIVSLDSIVDRCMVVQEYPGTHPTISQETIKDEGIEDTYNAVILLKNRNLWGDDFIN